MEGISRSSSKVELMWHPLKWLQHILIQIGANYPRIQPRDRRFTTPQLAPGQISVDHTQLRAVYVHWTASSEMLCVDFNVSK